jgi:hypothetical protein
MQRRRFLASALLTLPAATARAAASKGFNFAVFGDAPYGRGEEREFDRVIEHINADPSLRFAVHVGDLKSASETCSDALLSRRFAALGHLSVPWIYTPGDNDWTDCHQRGAGRFNPLDRLQFLRRVHFGAGARAHGPRGFALDAQSALPGFSAFVENACFELEDIVFATVHMVGSDNGLRPWSGIDPDDRTAAPRPERVAEVRERNAAALAWVDLAFDRAQARNARGVVLFFHANPSFERAADHARRRPFNAFLARVHDRAQAFERPVLLAHGDYHWYLTDTPFADLPRVVRMQVPGSPFVGWVKVGVGGGAANGDIFSFERASMRSDESP